MKFFATMFWENWHLRNLFIFERKKKDPQIPRVRAKATIEVYRRIKAPQNARNVR